MDMRRRNALQKLKNTTKARDRYRVWFTQADYDLGAARLSLEHSYHEWAAYQAQQAVEKSLKAVLIHSGWRPPRLHKLPTLMALANKVNPEFRKLHFAFKHLGSFTFISRYPFLIPGKFASPHDNISHADAKKAITQANNILEQISKLLEQPASAVMHEADEIEEYYSEREVGIRLEVIKTALITEFAPQKIILFGSFARDKHRPQSGTMDILIIAKTNKPFIERIKTARKATSGGSPSIDPLVYTPEEFSLMVDDEGEGFLESAVEEGEVLYERN